MNHATITFSEIIYFYLTGKGDLGVSFYINLLNGFSVVSMKRGAGGQ